MRGLALLVAAGALLLAPGAAWGSIAVSVDSSTNASNNGLPRADGTDAGETLTGAFQLDSNGATQARFSTPRSTAIQATSPCTSSNSFSATCPIGFTSALQAPVRMGGGDDSFTAGSNASGFRFTIWSVDLGAGNDRFISDGGQANASGGPGDDFIDTGTQGTGSTNGGDGQDLIKTGTLGPTVGGRGSDIVLASRRTSLNATISSESQTITLDGLCNDGGSADTSPADGSTRTLGPLSCAGNGVDRDNLGSAANAVLGGNVDDSLTGGDGDDALIGNRGNDTLVGAGGSDQMVGGEGDDLILARDGRADELIRCGDGNDRAVVDPEDPVEPDCETIERGGNGTPGPVGGGTPVAPGTPGVPPDATAPTAPLQPNVPSSEGGSGPGGGDAGKTPPEVKITSPIATLDKRGRAQLRVVCVYKAKACAGTVTLKAAKATKVRRRGRVLKLKKGAKIGSAKVSVPWGKSRPVNVPISRSARRFLAAAGKLSANAQVDARDSGAGKNAAVGHARRVVKLGAR